MLVSDIVEEVEDTKTAKKPYKEFDFKDFSNLDTSEDAHYLVASMNELFNIDAIQGIKQRALEMLTVQPGDKVLEIGCGLGHDAETFAELVGNTGSVVAMDSSQLMLAEAKKLSCHQNVHYRLGDASNLDYVDNTFDICHADRLLVSQIGYKRILQESVRVLRPGGRLGITDCDFGSIVIQPFDTTITPILLRRLQDITQNPLIGRQLLCLFKECGLINVSIKPEPYTVTSLAKLNTMINFPRIFSDLVYKKMLSREEANEQLKKLETADARGEFLYCIIFFTAIGTKQQL